MFWAIVVLIAFGSFVIAKRTHSFWQGAIVFVVIVALWFIAAGAWMAHKKKQIRRQNGEREIAED